MAEPLGQHADRAHAAIRSRAAAPGGGMAGRGTRREMTAGSPDGGTL